MTVNFTLSCTFWPSRISLFLVAAFHHCKDTNIYKQIFEDRVCFSKGHKLSVPAWRLSSLATPFWWVSEYYVFFDLSHPDLQILFPLASAICKGLCTFSERRNMHKRKHSWSLRLALYSSLVYNMFLDALIQCFMSSWLHMKSNYLRSSLRCLRNIFCERLATLYTHYYRNWFN